MKKFIVVLRLSVVALVMAACTGGGVGNFTNNVTVNANTPGYNRALSAEELKIKAEAEQLKKELDEMQKKVDAARPELENLNRQIEKTDREIEKTKREIEKQR